MGTVKSKIHSSFKNALPKSAKTIWWLLKLILPISLLVAFLQYWGVIAWMASYLSPAFSFIGLPGESAIVFLSSMFLPLYGPIAIIATLSLNIREVTILAIMCLISHNLFVESAIQRKTGSSGVTLFFIRLFVSFLAAGLFNQLLPDNMGQNAGTTTGIVYFDIFHMLLGWLENAGSLTLKMVLIITGLMLLQNILKEFNVLHLISKAFAPFMQIMGLSRDSAFLWFVAQTLGLTYGSVVMIESVENKEISPENAGWLNYHIAINHSLLEDTLLFVAIGVPAFWITIPRIILAMILVWLIRALVKMHKMREKA